MSAQAPVRYTKRYLRRFPNNSYAQDLLENLKVDTGFTKSAWPRHQPGRIATPHCLSYRIPKSQTACTQTLLRKMEELNGDTLKPSSHLKERNSEEEKQDRKFWRDLLHVEREAQDLYRTVERFWDSALDDGQVAANHWLRYQFKQFKKVPMFQNHPGQILLESRILKQAYQQRLRGVNSPEVHDGGHNAALVLVTPGLAGLVGQSSFEETILNLWPEDARHWRQYHLLTAVVDGTHLPDEDSSSTSEGISVIRGSKAVMFPNLWEDTSPREPEVKDDVGALTFDIGGVSTITIPLANTLFQNGKMSTLRATKVEGLAHKSKDIFEQHIRLPSMRGPKATGRDRTITNLRLPLEPVTELRIAKESFGNILRRIQIHNKTEPASIELETAIGQIQSRIARRSQELGIEFPGVWALVFEKENGHTPQWNVETRSSLDESSGTSLSMLINPLQPDTPVFKPNPPMGRPFKLLSGGGGWGDKAGLLALDPQTSHFAKSEEEMKQSLFGNKGLSTYIPSGAAVQFYISDERPPSDEKARQNYFRRGSSRLVDFPVDDGGAYLDAGDIWYKKNSQTDMVHPPEKKTYFGIDGVPRLVFGVGSRLPAPPDHDTEMSLHVGEFGAISNKAIYLAPPETQPLSKHPWAQYAPEIKPMKLDMPGAQVQLSSW